MEVVEKSIGTCRRWNRKKLICCVITLLIQSIETQFFIVWGLIMIIQHHLNKQSAGQSIPQWVGKRAVLRLLPAPALRTLAMWEGEWGTHPSACPVSWATAFNWKAYSQWKTCLKVLPETLPSASHGFQDSLLFWRQAHVWRGMNLLKVFNVFLVLMFTKKKQ